MNRLRRDLRRNIFESKLAHNNVANSIYLKGSYKRKID